MIQNAAHLHLIVNHWALFGIPLAAVVLAWGEWKGLADFKKLGFVLLIVSALMTVVAFQSGENSEDIVENLPGVSEPFIEEHEEAAEPAAIASYAAGLLALVGLILQMKKSQVPRALVIVILLAAIVAVGLMGRAAQLGGKIHHPEVRGGDFALGDGESQENGSTENGVGAPADAD